MVSGQGAWRIAYHDQVASTQTLARGQPVWSAVAARQQTSGRGQAERSFVSDPGGLYVTAVLPYDGDPLAGRGFALAVGWALRDRLSAAGVARLRLRWPNDLMVEERKVGGILVEQGGPDTLLVGVGLNVNNQPWLVDPSLAHSAGRLADALEPGTSLPDHAQIADIVLQAVRRAYEVFAQVRLPGIVPRLAACWGEPREVNIEPAHGVTLPVSRGLFYGIDADGRLLLRPASGAPVTIPAHHVGRLREIAG